MQKHRQRSTALLSLALSLGASAAACKHAEPPANDASSPDAQADADGGAEVPDAGPRPPQRGWWSDRVFYEIFVRSFADADGDGIGDFKGLTAKLDTLQDGNPATTTDLGVGGLWLMPIQASPSYHGYDVTDYRALNPQYGTMADFEAFIAAAHQRGLKVIIDYVLNHASLQHPYFAAADKRDWFVWRSDDPGWRQPWGSGAVWHARGGAYYYGVFWSGMPDWNLRNAAVEAEHLENLRFWLAKGVDGFRVDAARHLYESAAGDLSDQPESHALIKRLRAALVREHPDVLLVAEAWTNLPTVAQYYGDADEFHLAFGFDTAAAVKTAAKDGLRASMNQLLQTAEDSYRDRGYEAPFLSNHDMARVARELADPGALRVAAASYLALPGTPFLYYGEEIGMVGGPTPADEDKRTPMRWTADAASQFGFTTGRPWRTAVEAAGTDVASQRGAAGSLWTLYRELIALRGQHPALSRGGASRPTIDDGSRGVVAWVREEAGQRVLFVVNYHPDVAPAFSVQVAGTPTVLFAEGLATPPAVAAGKLSFAGGLAGRGFALIAL